MTKSTPYRSYFRTLRVLGACGLAVGFCLSAIASPGAAAPSAPVAAIESTRVADLVLLGRGFDAGFRSGMVCRITRGTTEVAEVLLVDLRPTCSAALILTLAPKQSIRAGDVVTVKIQKV